MLGKLIKYEFKATGRNILPIYAALVVLAFINKVLWKTSGLQDGNVNFNNTMGIIGTISMLFYMFVFAAGCIITLIIIIQRFYKNLLKDEGYLMNTLPVTPSMNIASKLITAVVWSIFAGVVSIISMLILAYYPGMFTEVKEAFIHVLTDIPDIYGRMIYTVGFEVLILMIVTIFASILMIYVSMVIGQLFNRRRILASIVSFVVINFVLNIVFGIFMAFMVGLINTASAFLNIQIILVSMIIISLAISIVFFVASSYIMKNKLNLE